MVAHPGSENPKAPRQRGQRDRGAGDVGTAATLVDELGIDVRPMLAVIRRRLGMDVAWLSTFEDHAPRISVVDGDGARFGLREGRASALDTSICVRVADGRLPNIVVDARKHPITSDLPTSSINGVHAYIGIPIVSSNAETVGMLCAASDAAVDLGASDLEMLGSFGELIARLVAEHRPANSDRLMIGRGERVRGDLAAGRLRSVLQPIVDIGTKTAVGVEALTRVDGSDIRPDEWFADAHAAGVGIEAELAAISLALDSFNVLPPHMYLSVNASPDTAVDQRLV
ncbi:MAG: GAF domain-containing protein, partial [Ilumatobacter sp.]